MEPTAPEAARGPELLRVLVGAAAAVVVVAGLKAASAIFLPFALALFLSVLSLPLLELLRRRRVPSVLAVALTMAAAAAVLTVVALVLHASVATLAENLPRYQEQVREAVVAAVVWLEQRGVDVPGRISVEQIDLRAVVDVLGTTFLGLATAVSNVFLVLLVMVFLLWESLVLPERLAVIRRTGPVDPDRWRRILARVQRYLVLKTFISLATGLLLGLACELVGLDFALFLGFVAFLLNFIPNIGSVVAALPAVALALLQLGTARALVLAVIYLAVNVVVGNVLEPTVMGRGLRLSPLAIFLSLLFWGWVWGPLGMILSVPLTVTAKILLESSPRLAWAAVLMDRRPRPLPAAPAPPERPPPGE